MNEMECPNPQPGQNENPKFFIGHNEKCVSEGLMKANQVRPPIQKMSSMFIRFNIVYQRCMSFKYLQAIST
jgi:hypothetical protein